MLLDENTLRLSPAQQTAMGTAIRLIPVPPPHVLAALEGRAGQRRQRPAAYLPPSGSGDRLRPAPHLPGAPDRRLPRLGSDQTLLRAWCCQAPWYEGLPPLPALLPLGRIPGHRLDTRS